MSQLLKALPVGLLIASLVLTCVLAPPASADEVTLKGTVVDMDDKPLQEADVATIWLEGNPAGGVRTDKDGNFELKANHYGRGLAVMVMSKDRKLGAVAVVSPSRMDQPVNLFASKLVEVRGKLTCKDLGAPPPWSNVYVNLMPGNTRVARCMSEEAEFSFRLPAGMFKLHMYGTDVRGYDKSVDIEDGDQGKIDLGDIDLKATPIAKLYDKKLPPWNVTDARGAEKDVKLSDYKGKWVLIEFWFST